MKNDKELLRHRNTGSAKKISKFAFYWRAQVILREILAFAEMLNACQLDDGFLMRTSYSSYQLYIIEYIKIKEIYIDHRFTRISN